MTASPPAHILVVDDETVAAATLARFLCHRGYSVSTAENGEEGLALVRERTIDLIISDIRMPVMDGEQMLLALRAFDGDVPVVVVTGQDWEPPGGEKALNIARIMAKPIGLRVLTDLVAALLDRSGP